MKNKSAIPVQNINTYSRGGYQLSHQCFYCTNETNEKEIHHVTFHVSDTDKDEILCSECYQEWLHGIKG